MIKYNLYGNSEVWHNLVKEVLNNQVAHAYIFSGTKAIGKSTTAREYIKYLANANEVLAKRIDEGNFLDLLYITKQDKNEISIDMIRKAGEFFKQTPAEGTQKFVIIDAADDLNLNSANALLKILEEPSPNTHLFLINHNLKNLLPTIKSRCRIIKFKPIEPKELKLAANMGKLAFLEDFIAGSIGKAKLCEELDLVDIYVQLLQLLEQNNILEFNKFADKNNPQEWQLIFELVEYALAQIIKISSNAIAKLDELSEELILPISRRKSLEEWFETRDKIAKSFKDLAIYNLDKKQTLLLAIEAFRANICKE